MDNLLDMAVVSAVAGGLFTAGVLAYRWLQEKRLSRPLITAQSKDTLHRASTVLKAFWGFIALLIANQIADSVLALETFVALACLTSPVWVYEAIRWVFQRAVTLQAGFAGTGLIFLIAHPIKAEINGTYLFHDDFAIFVTIQMLAFWIFVGMQKWQNGLQSKPHATVKEELSSDVKKFLYGTRGVGTDRIIIELLALTMATAMNINSHLIGKTSGGNPIGSFLVAFGLIAFELLRRTRKLDVDKKYLLTLYKFEFSSNIAETLFANLPETEQKQKNELLQKQIDCQLKAARDAFEKVKQEGVASLLFPIFDILQSDYSVMQSDDEKKTIIKSVMPPVAQKVDKIILAADVPRKK